MLRPNPEIELIVEKASEFAAKYGHTYVTTEHLSLALINYKNFRTMLEEFGTDWQGLNDAFIKYLKENNNPYHKLSKLLFKKENKFHCGKRCKFKCWRKLAFNGQKSDT